MRKFLLILPIILLAIIVGVGLYYLFLSPKSATPAGTTGSLPNAGTQSNPAAAGTNLSGNTQTIGKNFGLISNEPVLDYFVNSANLVTAIEPSGKIVQISGGQVNTINALLIQNILSASFSYDGAKILVNFGDPSNPQTSIFDVASKAWTPLNQGILSPVWSPSNYKIAYYTVSDAVETFATLDISKAKPTPVLLMTLHAQDLSIAWPSTNQLVLATKPTAYAPGSAWLYTISTNSLTTVADSLTGLDLLWQGNMATTSALEFSAPASGFGGTLSLIDAAGNTTNQLKFLTLPSKCAFAIAMTTSTPAVTVGTSTTPLVVTTSTNYLFCGVPRDQEDFANANLPDEYNQMTLFTSDDLYRINLENGAVDTIFDDATQNLDVTDVKFFNNMLFFVNRYDNKLYAISLSA